MRLSSLAAASASALWAETNWWRSRRPSSWERARRFTSPKRLSLRARALRSSSVLSSCFSASWRAASRVAPHSACISSPASAAADSALDTSSARRSASARAVASLPARSTVLRERVVRSAETRRCASAAFPRRRRNAFLRPRTVVTSSVAALAALAASASALPAPSRRAFANRSSLREIASLRIAPRGEGIAQLRQPPVRCRQRRRWPPRRRRWRRPAPP